jgi:hypothetical protein
LLELLLQGLGGDLWCEHSFRIMVYGPIVATGSGDSSRCTQFRWQWHDS